MSKNVIVSMIEVGRVELERAALAVHEDKLSWKPLDNGRTVLDALGSAAQAPLLCAAILRGERPSPAMFPQMEAERASWTRDDALRHLEGNTEALLEALQKVDDAKLDEPLFLPMGGGKTLPLGAWALMAYRSFAARTAQINYIQTLYGDFELH
jgi:hypothetical protein